MIILYIGVVVALVILVMWVFVAKDEEPSNTDKLFEDGFTQAIYAIDLGYDPQKLYNECLKDGCDDSWDKGWMAACRERGAKHE